MMDNKFDFVAIDFEIANYYRGSVCSVGIVCFKDSECVKESLFLVKPKVLDFIPLNTYINGIEESMVIDAPEFDKVFESHLEELLINQNVVSHSASFDMSVLRYVCEDYNLQIPNFDFLCTGMLSRHAYPLQNSFSLSHLCNEFKIDLQHHNSLSSAKACGMIFNKILADTSSKDFDSICELTKIRRGSFKDSKFLSCSFKEIYTLKEYEADPSLYNEASPYFGKKVMFTGSLSSMTRAEAQKMVLDIGGSIGTSVTSETNYLVVGIQDYAKFGEGFESSKLKKAKSLKAKGQDIEIISEVDFFREIEPVV